MQTNQESAVQQRPRGIYYGIKVKGVETNGAGLLAIASVSSLMLYLAGLGIVSAIPFVFLAMSLFPLRENEPESINK